MLLTSSEVSRRYDSLAHDGFKLSLLYLTSLQSCCVKLPTRCSAIGSCLILRRVIVIQDVPRLKASQVPITYVPHAGLLFCAGVKSHYGDMINGWSCLYKSRFKHTIPHSLFSPLHPSLRSAFPWVTLRCNQHIAAAPSVSTLSDGGGDDDDDDVPALAILFGFGEFSLLLNELDELYENCCFGEAMFI